MTARQKRIWDLLAEHDCLTSQQIAALLHIVTEVRCHIMEPHAWCGKPGDPHPG
ncbi:MAG: hypothetical protein SPG10_12870 [Enterocloster clostridioformis]|uniref:hypothetical protein n=1 Tax=Enterocloster clostridioformis TaxID=1531 RepID=UPI00040B889F|nr:hypothetical protein [Enterocloster clostridioformis]MDY5477724.1 hypothetical protein [Enterocloster clostridioformis]